MKTVIDILHRELLGYTESINRAKDSIRQNEYNIKEMSAFIVTSKTAIKELQAAIAKLEGA